MQPTPDHDEKMPDRVVVCEALSDEEDQSDTIHRYS